MAGCEIAGHLEVGVVGEAEVAQVVKGGEDGGNAAEAVARQVQDSQVAQVGRQQLGQLPQMVLAQVQAAQAVQVAHLRATHTPIRAQTRPTTVFLYKIATFVILHLPHMAKSAGTSACYLQPMRTRPHCKSRINGQ